MATISQLSKSGISVKMLRKLLKTNSIKPNFLVFILDFDGKLLKTNNVDLQGATVCLLSTRQFNLNASNVSPKLRKWLDSWASMPECWVMVEDKFGRVWRWRRWKEPYATSRPMLYAKLAQAKFRRIYEFTT